MAEFDAIVVLGAALDATGGTTLALRRRARHGAALLNAGVGGALILSGGKPVNGLSEAEAMFQVVLGQACDPERVLLESASTNTWENARNTADLLRRHGWRDVLVVSDRWHLPRVQVAFRAQGVPVRVSAPRAFDLSVASQLRYGGYEALALPWYLLRVAFSRPPSSGRGGEGRGSREG